MFDLPKFCSDSLRNHVSLSSVKLKPSHAHELVAAFFGYKSHTALLHEAAYPIDNLEDAAILVPDLQLLEVRRHQLKELPDNLPETANLAQAIVLALQGNGYFSGDVWLYETLGSYVTEVLLIDSDGHIMDELSGQMAETNAEFSDFPHYEEPKVAHENGEVVVTVDGKYQGDSIDDKPFSGDTIDFRVTVTLPRIAGKIGFGDFDLDAGGAVRDDWRDTETHYEIPNVRPKDQWLAMTGGFRLGETDEQFQSRTNEMHTLRNRIAKGQATERDVSRLSSLLGEDDEY